MHTLIKPNSASELLDAIGRDKVRVSIFGLTEVSARSGKHPGEKAISQAAWSQTFPAHWYGVLKDLSEEVGMECPLDLFNFKPMRDAK